MASQTIEVTGYCRGALVTLAEYYVYANISGTPDNADQIAAALLHATEWIETFVGRHFDIGSWTAIEKFRGNGKSEYYPQEAPIRSVTSVEVWNGSSWDDVESTTSLEPTHDGNGIYFREGGNFTSALIPDYWRITYEYGYDYVPQPVKRACMMIAFHYADRSQMRRIASQSDNNMSFSYFRDSQDIPQEAVELLRPYKRFATANGPV